MRVMIIDVGSNTVKYDLYSVKKGGYRILDHGSVAARLISYIDAGTLSPAGTELLCGILRDYVKIAKKHRCKQVCAFATASFRRIDDRRPVNAAIAEKTGLEVCVLSGEEEAALSLTGMLTAIGEEKDPGVMIDMGGGSTELNVFENGASVWAHSHPFGALSLKERYAPSGFPDGASENGLRAYVLSQLPKEAAEFGKKAKTAYLVGGTARACAKLAQAFLGKERGERLSSEEFSSLTEIICRPDGNREAAMRAICPDRYTLLPSGCAAFDEIFKAIGIREIVFCRGGVREGYLSRICGEELKLKEKKE